MDTLDKILTLLQAGYTREEITTMLAPPADNPSRDPVPAPAPAGGAPAPDPSAPAPDPGPVLDTAQIMGAIKSLGDSVVSSLQRAQNGGSIIPGAADPNPVPDTAQILGAIKLMGDNIVSSLQRAQIGGSNIPGEADPSVDPMSAVMAAIIAPNPPTATK